MRRPFSQSSLQDFRECAYRFYLAHELRVRSPDESVDRLEDVDGYGQRGRRFHWMAQQWLAGVPMEVLAASDDDVLTGWWARFVRGGLRGLPAMRLSEVSLSVGLGKGRLMAKPDLLAISPGERVVIVDYKTSRKVSAKALRERLQTRVYMYVVTRAVEGLFGQPVRPEQVEMRYWFVNEERPSVTLAYSQDVYAADEVYLADLIARAVATESFDKTDDVSKCRRCGYRRVCERGLQVMGAETEGI